MNEIVGLLESGDSPVSPLSSPRSLGHRYVLLCLALCWFPSLNLGPYPCVAGALSTEPLPQPTSQNSTYPFKPPHSLPYSEDAIAYLKVQCVFSNVCTCVYLRVCECAGTCVCRQRLTRDGFLSGFLPCSLRHGLSVNLRSLAG